MNQGKGLEKTEVQARAVVSAERGGGGGGPSLAVSPPEERGWGLSTDTAYDTQSHP